MNLHEIILILNKTIKPNNPTLSLNFDEYLFKDANRAKDIYSLELTFSYINYQDENKSINKQPLLRSKVELSFDKSKEYIDKIKYQSQESFLTNLFAWMSYSKDLNGTVKTIKNTALLSYNELINYGK